MKEMRSSVFLAGSLLARCGEAVISQPGRLQDMVDRPVDLHLRRAAEDGGGCRVCRDGSDPELRASVV